MNKKQIQERLLAIKSSLEAYRAKGDAATAEEAQAASTLVAETKTLRGQLETLLSADSIGSDLQDLDTFLTGTAEPEGKQTVPNTVRHSAHTDEKSDDDAGLETKRYKVPAVARRSKVTMFTGSNAVEKAYAFGMWCLASLMNNSRAKDYCKQHGVLIKAQLENDNSGGGFLVPPEFDTDLIDLRERFGIFRQNVKIVPMKGDSKTILRRTGGPSAYWVDEGQTITDSRKQWDRVGLTAKKLATLILMSSELNDDSVVDLGEDLAMEIAYAFAKAEDAAGFVGDGSANYGKITGVTNRLLALSATKANIAGLRLSAGANNSGWGGVTLGDLTATVALLPEYADTNMKGGDGDEGNVSTDVKWFCHRTFFYNVMVQIMLAAGGVTEKEIAQLMIKPMFMGYPVQFTQVLPNVSASAQIPVLFGNLRFAAKLGDRRQTTIAMSSDRYFEADELALRGTERLDINVHDVGNASATASQRQAGPIVGLYTS